MSTETPYRVIDITTGEYSDKLLMETSAQLSEGKLLLSTAWTFTASTQRTPVKEFKLSREAWDNLLIFAKELGWA